jgi:hypothetical protein
MSAIRKLIEAVERDEWSASGDGSDTWLKIHDAGLRQYHERIFEAWRQGSLDAARALHEAVLPLPWVAVVMTANERMKPGAMVCKVVDGTVHADDEFKAEADTPARAWLIAILKALAAQQCTAP